MTYQYDFTDPAIVRMVTEHHTPVEHYGLDKFPGAKVDAVVCKACSNNLLRLTDWPCGPVRQLRAFQVAQPKGDGPA